MLNRQGRPISPGEAGIAAPAIDGLAQSGAAAADTRAHPTFTGNRALQQEEALIFEIGRPGTTGVDF